MAIMKDSYPLKRIVSPTITSTNSGSEPGVFSRDEAELARFGKKQQLRVCDSFFMNSHPEIVLLTVFSSDALAWSVLSG